MRSFEKKMKKKRGKKKASALRASEKKPQNFSSALRASEQIQGASR
jgi:hypothetical protein